ncbi:bifunctional nicotinamidase/pyrazinamidase [Erwinia psidii]|uniref:Nicotinamidase n=1 Tax=Erwinia psidii TaxID=69224 RepID=A0A3N6SLP6_9GAMM|nr:bifunctional nicotinamidase/pyrazinamidase [Erwinia psidii]MCX8955900.1 bifunctional nicotinamidase/pyrazinamidase [Erwinia psidii]MCX8961272.1 bifunctional nicotinamidase/pyrazinamidase [Erwinia psidii]RQM38616.1 bifunctional nicotinamidase/pyrazinamidase [Erwinia psidii]
MTSQHALLLIDLQNDFCPGGALAVGEGDRVIAIANHYAAEFRQRNRPVVATLDWHPAGHGSFSSASGQPAWTQGELDGLPQIWWPDHCVQHSEGAALHPVLHEHLISTKIYKGEDVKVDSYSAFFDNGHRRQTLLDSWLKQQQVTALTVMGLATDYCVKYSVLDALALGYTTTVIAAGCRGVDLQPGDSERALGEMAAKGAIIV